MKIQKTKTLLTVIREKSEKKIYSESRFYHLLKKHLNKLGWDLIKKRMWKDGHMVSEQEFYLRSRKINKSTIGIVYPYNLICGAQKDFNQGSVSLVIHELGKD